ncbi:MAG: DUF1080 domain-containing protein [Pirellulales bacterium]|nr:DUF1080 domain-containing protein [Pirellulales bacterium]
MVRSIVIAFFCSVLVTPLFAEDKPVRIAIDPAKAGPEFAVQGEYMGELSTGESIGVQVIALGDGQFEAVVFMGGLPGEPGSEEQPINSARGETTDGVTTITSEHGKGIIADGKMTIYDTGGMELGVLEKIERKSPTLGAAPPAGAIVLFDGTSADHFRSARVLPGGALPAGAFSKESFGDGKLHLEFRTPFMPKHRGQDRGNSGVYLQKRYEVQVLDSFGLPKKDNECGGLYGFHEPRLNMCFPPLAWQTYEIDFRAPKFDADGKKTAHARLTVALNGVTIHDGAEMPHESGLGQAESPEPGPLMLQFHLAPVQYRNIWFLPVPE